MKTINIHEPKTPLSRLVDGPSAVVAPEERHRLGFLNGEIDVPDDFDRMGESEIAASFEDGA
jgi:hypothetical protein